MRRLIKIGIFISLLVSAVGVQAQENKIKIFVTNNVDGGAGTSVKWIMSTLIADKGFNIYRNTQGSEEWVKVNDRPITVNRSSGDSELTSETDKQYFKIIKDRSFEELQSNKMVLVFSAIQAIYSNQFATAIGVMYNDVRAEEVSVRYKIAEIGTNEEVELGISEYFSVGTKEKIIAPDSIYVERTKNSTAIGWKPEVDKFFGVNIYRSTNGSSYELITDKPIRMQKNAEGEYATHFYRDQEVTGEKEYAYQLESVDYFGRVSTRSQTISVRSEAGDDKAAPFVSDINTNGIKMLVNVSWNPIEDQDLKGYNVYLKEDEGEATRVNSALLESTSHSFGSKSIGSKLVQVEAVYEQGNKRSNWMYTELFDQIPPVAPENFNVISDTGVFIMKWKPVVAPDLAGYYIERALVGDSIQKWLRVNGTPIDTNYFELKVSKENTTNFAYRVLAADTNYNSSEPSNTISSQQNDVLAPEQPVVIEANTSSDTSGGNYVQLRWLPNVESDLVGYHVLRRVQGDSGAYQKVNFELIPKEISAYKDRRAKEGMSYEYVVVAEDQSGLKSEPSEINTVVIPVNIAALIPMNIEIKTNNKKKTILLAWAETNTERLAGYTLYAGLDNKNLKPASGLFRENNIELKKEPGTYYLQLRAVAKDGQIGKSEIIQTTIKTK